MRFWGISTSDFFGQSKQALKIALPIIFGQLGLVFMGFFDLLMVGKVGTNEIAAVGVANAMFFLFFMFAMGVMFSISPLVAIACGSGRGWKSILVLKSATKIGLLLSSFLFLLYSFLTYNFEWVGQTPEVAELCKDYLNIVNWSVWPLLIFAVYKQYLDGHSRTVPASAITLVGLVLNIVLNYLFIYGWEFIPAMGLKGAAWATLVVRAAMAIALVYYVHSDKDYKSFVQTLKSKYQFTHNYVKKVWRMGYPIGLQFFFEVAAFSFAAIMAGWIGAIPQASHNIALNLASVTFMGATGLAAAGSVLVGNAYGAANFKQLLQSGKVIIFLVLLYMSFCALMFVVFNQQLALTFSQDPEVIRITVSLLILAAIFQIPDGLQSAGLGLLRGMKDVKIPSFIAFFSYWIAGIPVSYVLGIKLDWGVNGVWVGFIVGLSFASILIIQRFFRLLKRLNTPNL